jgi:hypothetical protein
MIPPPNFKDGAHINASPVHAATANRAKAPVPDRMKHFCNEAMQRLYCSFPGGNIQRLHAFLPFGSGYSANADIATRS